MSKFADYDLFKQLPLNKRVRDTNINIMRYQKRSHCWKCILWHLLALCGFAITVIHASPIEGNDDEIQRGLFTLTGDGIDRKLFNEVFGFYGAIPAKSKNGDSEKKLKSVHGTTWSVYVPAHYQPEKSYGVFIYINSSDTGEIPREWIPVFDAHNLIWVGPNHAGNNVYPKINTLWRHALAIESVNQIKKHYNVDTERVYISGRSGGGRVASHVAIFNSDLFKGALYIVGCNPYRPIEVAAEVYMPGFKREPTGTHLFRARQNRFVMLTGTNDFNRGEMRAVYDLYVEDRFRHVSYFEVPGMGHHQPPAEWFEDGIIELDKPLMTSAQKEYDRAVSFEKRNQFNKALAGFTAASQSRVNGIVFVLMAEEKASSLRDRYAKAIIAIEEAISSGNRNNAKSLLNKFKKSWKGEAEEDISRLTVSITKGSVNP